MKRIITFLVGILLVLFLTASNTKIVNEVSSKAANWVGNRNYPTNQPRPWSWHGDLDLLVNWTPESDPDRDYNRGTVALQEKFTNEDYWVNPNAKDSGYISIVGPWWPSQNSGTYVSSGSDHFDIQTFTWSQYNDIYIMFNNWHYLPSVEMIDACHRNGVKVYSLIMNPDTDEVTKLIQKDGDKFPGADKMVEIAEYYGFDGWFFNFESGGNTYLAEQVRDFLLYFNTVGEPKGIRIMWYDSWVESGQVSYQNELNTNNDWYFHYDDKPAAQEMFLNYWYSEQDLIDSRDLAISYRGTPWDVHAGFETWQQYWNRNGELGDKDVLNVMGKLSISLFQMNGMIDVAEDNDDFYRWGEKFYSGNNYNPANTETNNDWKGIAHWYPAKSVINQLPFVTNFTVGNGHIYSVDGEVLRQKDWNNRAIQDISPTWRWNVEGGNNGVNPKFEFSDSYYGGNSILIPNELFSNSLLKLYMTDLEVTSSTKFEVAYKTGKTNTASNIKLAISFVDAPDNWEYIDLGETTTDGWNLAANNLSSFAGRTIGAIGFYFDNANLPQSDTVLIGRLGIYDNIEKPLTAFNFNVEDKVEDNTNIASVRLRWSKSISNNIRQYNIYRINLDGSRTFLGASSTNAYLVPSIEREENEEKCTLELEAVDKTYRASDRVTTSFDWSTVGTPNLSSRPNPADGTPIVSVNPTISWAAAEGATSYDVYIGTSDTPEFFGNQTELILELKDLEFSTNYFWKINPRNDFGASQGVLWKFTTHAAGVPSFDRSNDENGKILAQDDNAANGEGKDKAFDDLKETKWLDFHPTSWIHFQFGNGNQYQITEYSITSANDAPERDPYNWTLSGSNDGTNWKVIDERVREDFVNRFQKNTYWCNNQEAYEYYRFDIENNTGGIIQLAEIDLIDYAGYTVAPTAASNPVPENGTDSLGVITTLTWDVGANTFSHNIYLSESSNFSENDLIGNVTTNRFATPLLKPNTQYYWRVDELNNIGTAEGEVWKFTTAEADGDWLLLTFDNFENGFGNFVSGGRNCKLYERGLYSASGENAVNLQGAKDDASALILGNSIDLENSELIHIKIDFMFFPKQYSENEGFDIEYSNGGEWILLKEFRLGDEFELNSLHHSIVHLIESEHEFSENTLIRFVNAGTATNDDVYIDDVKIYGTSSTTVDINDNGLSSLPTEYGLEQNYPNPFNPITNIRYQLPEAGNVNISVYNVNGQKMETLVNTGQSAGHYNVIWEASKYSSGIYFMVMKSNSFYSAKKMILLK